MRLSNIHALTQSNSSEPNKNSPWRSRTGSTGFPILTPNFASCSALSPVRIDASFQVTFRSPT